MTIVKTILLIILVLIIVLSIFFPTAANQRAINCLFAVVLLLMIFFNKFA